MRYPYLLFDADNTLFDFDANELVSFRNTIAAQNIAYTDEKYTIYHRCNAQLWHAFDLGQCTKDFLLVERFRRFLAEIGEDGSPEEMNRDHLAGLALSALLFPGALELCQKLSGQHDLYIITNAVESVQRKRFNASPLAPYFKGVFISETVGHSKPSKEFFDHVLRAVPGMTQENTLVIGDSLSSDILGANNAGLSCCWYNPKGAPRPADLRIDYEVRRLEDILPIANQ